MFTISLSIDLPWLVVVPQKNFGPHFLVPEDGLGCAFISYADENRDMAYRLAIELEKFNVTVWLSGHDPIIGLKKPRALLLALRNGVRFIACFSRESRGACNSRMKGEIEVAAAELLYCGTVLRQPAALIQAAKGSSPMFALAIESWAALT
jgi:hypothetical protein